MSHCIYCRGHFETSTREHILQNALGTTWTCDHIVCNEHQKFFGDTIDLELAKQMEMFRNFFEVKTGRGGEPRRLDRLPTTDGRIRSLEPGARLALSEPEVKVDKIGEKKHLKLAMRNSHDVGWALHKLQEIDPSIHLDPSEVKKHMVKEPLEADATVKLQLTLGGRDGLRAIAKSAFNFLAASGADVFRSDFDPVRDFILNGNGKSESFCRYAHDNDFIPQPKLGEIDHGIFVFSRSQTVEAFVQLYGTVQISVLLSSNYDGPKILKAFIADPERIHRPSDFRNIPFDPTHLPVFYNQGQLPGPSSWNWMISKFNRTMAYYSSKIFRAQLTEIVEKILGPHEGKRITPELNDELKKAVIELLISHLCTKEPTNSGR